MSLASKRILYTNDAGGLSVIVPAPGVSLAELLNSPAVQEQLHGREHELVDASKVPTDRTFRDAWYHDREPTPQKVGVDLEKARGISHDLRRKARASEFAPHDLMATIPAQAEQAELARQEIRDRYAIVQDTLDACKTPDELKQALCVAGILKD